MPQSLYLRETAQVHILEEGGGAQQRSGRVLEDRKPLAATGIYFIYLYIYIYLFTQFIWTELA
jgi:hypothetical protein